jgi:hypothetical protein
MESHAALLPLYAIKYTNVFFLYLANKSQFLQILDLLDVKGHLPVRPHLLQNNVPESRLSPEEADDRLKTSNVQVVARQIRLQDYAFTGREARERPAKAVIGKVERATKKNGFVWLLSEMPTRSASNAAARK